MELKSIFQKLYSLWESYGAKILISKADITAKSGCEELLNESTKFGPVGGIFNLASQLADGILENQTATTFAQCMAPKALATRYLDELSRKLCPDLHYFVVFSSAACGSGNAGQTNYGMANSVMERIIEKRHGDGLPAKAIQWGAIADVGLVYNLYLKNNPNRSDVDMEGTVPESISSCLDKLDLLISNPNPIVLNTILIEKKSGHDSELRFTDKILRIFNIKSIKSIPPEMTLSELGFDSLGLIELKTQIERELKMQASIDELKSMKFSKFIEMLGLSKTVMFEKVEKRENVVDYLLKDLIEESSTDAIITRVSSLNSENEFSSHLLFIPGSYGMTSSMKKMCSILNLPCFALQISNVECENIHDFAQHVFEVRF
jgi:fatty acid synthase